MKMRHWMLLGALWLWFGVPVFAQATTEEPVPDDRITIEQLKRKMDAGEKLVILDARKGSAWIGSTVKIKGAIHCTNEDLEAKIPELPRDREIVIYCA